MIKRVIIAVLALGFAPLAFGQGMGMGMGVAISFADMDADGNGTLSKEEVGKVVPAARLDQAFSRWDADEDGQVTEEEFKNRPGPPGMGG